MTQSSTVQRNCTFNWVGNCTFQNFGPEQEKRYWSVAWEHLADEAELKQNTPEFSKVSYFKDVVELHILLLGDFFMSIRPAQTATKNHIIHCNVPGCCNIKIPLPCYKSSPASGVLQLLWQFVMLSGIIVEIVDRPSIFPCFFFNQNCLITWSRNAIIHGFCDANKSLHIYSKDIWSLYLKH